MFLVDYFKKIRDTYVIRQVERLKLPKFQDSPLTRKKFIFRGRVQKVGFRLSTFEIASRLGLTGFVKNLDARAVEAEFQGQSDRIDYLIGFLNSLKRISIKTMVEEELDYQSDEKDFKII